MQQALAAPGSLPDPATNLVHLGNGRFYDPTLGRPLQPNPTGGPPTVPQALNRYAATSVGQPGVMEATVTSLTGLSLATSFAKSAAFETLARATWGPLGTVHRNVQAAYSEVYLTASYRAQTKAFRKVKQLGGKLLDPDTGGARRMDCRNST
jgi:hypothetical protein